MFGVPSVDAVAMTAGTAPSKQRANLDSGIDAAAWSASMGSVDASAGAGTRRLVVALVDLEHAGHVPGRDHPLEHLPCHAVHRVHIPEELLDVASRSSLVLDRDHLRSDRS